MSVRDDILNMSHQPIIVDKLALYKKRACPNNLLFTKIFTNDCKVLVGMGLKVRVAIYRHDGATMNLLRNARIDFYLTHKLLFGLFPNRCELSKGLQESCKINDQ